MYSYKFLSLHILIEQASSVEGRKHSLITDYILKVLGLDICADTKVGSDMVRGVSGGQKKRVTTGNHSFWCFNKSANVPMMVFLC